MPKKKYRLTILIKIQDKNSQCLRNVSLPEGVRVGVHDDKNEGHAQVEYEPDVDHLHVGGLGQLLDIQINNSVFFFLRFDRSKRERQSECEREIETECNRERYRDRV